jgi:hypothetical protein
MGKVSIIFGFDKSSFAFMRTRFDGFIRQYIKLQRLKPFKRVRINAKLQVRLKPKLLIRQTKLFQHIIWHTFPIIRPIAHVTQVFYTHFRGIKTGHDKISHLIEKGDTL